MRGKALIHSVRHLLGWDAASTQTTPRERDAIGRYADNRYSAVEIGVYEGVSTAIIARNLKPNGKLYAIDPFFPGALGVCWAKMTAQAEVRRARVASKVKFVRALSNEACKQIRDVMFDYIFIDGDHSFTAIRQDWEDWSPRVESGGVILLHDTEIPNHNPNVKALGSYKYFREFIVHDNRFRVIETIDSLNVLRRV